MQIICKGLKTNAGYILNSELHSINTRYSSHLHIPTVHLTKYQKGVYYSGIRVFNHLPQNIKNLSWDVKKFKSAVNKFLLVGSFYTLEEYSEWISNSDLVTFI